MLTLTYQYVRWHYTQGVVDLVNNVINFLWFVYNFFSIPLLLRTMFVPFHRLEEQAMKGLHLEQWAQAMLVTTLMRFVGALLRTFLILIALVFLALVFAGGFALLIVWIAMPLVLIFLVTMGVALVSVG